MSLHKKEEIFAIDIGQDRYCLYSPLRRAVAMVNGSACNTVLRYLESGRDSLTQAEEGIINKLEENGLIGGEMPNHPDYPPDYGFNPHEVTLFLTSCCNLRCIYCYADSGKRSVQLSWEAAKAAIDLVAHNAGLAGRDNFVLGFHGGGEPTLAWDMMQRCVEYSEKVGMEKGLKPFVHTASNGILGKEQREYIINHFTGINISMDGPREIQDRQRPCADGSGSFDRVMESLLHFKKAGFGFDIRATVTRWSTPFMEEIVKFFCEEFPNIGQLHIEPAWYCGRCHTTGEQPPAEDEFIKHFLSARKIAGECGVNLFYSGARVDSITNRFCGAAGEGFSVMPEGNVSACYEVCDPDDPRAAVFHYGRFDRDTGGYIFDDEKLINLRKLSVNHIPYCRDCFCKWHCAGDCMVRAVRTNNAESHHGSERCRINREISLAQLMDIVENYQGEEEVI